MSQGGNREHMNYTWKCVIQEKFLNSSLKSSIKLHKMANPGYITRPSMEWTEDAGIYKKFLD